MKASQQGRAVALTTELEEQDFCTNLYRRGHTVAEVAVKASAHFDKEFSTTWAWRRINAARERHRETSLANVGEWRELEIAKLDAQAKETYAGIEKLVAEAVPNPDLESPVATPYPFDHKTFIGYQALLIRIAERRAKLLGLDAPVESVVTVVAPDEVAAELQAMLAERTEGA